MSLHPGLPHNCGEVGLLWDNFSAHTTLSPDLVTNYIITSHQREGDGELMWNARSQTLGF